MAVGGENISFILKEQEGFGEFGTFTPCWYLFFQSRGECGFQIL